MNNRNKSETLALVTAILWGIYAIYMISNVVKDWDEYKLLLEFYPGGYSLAFKGLVLGTIGMGVSSAICAYAAFVKNLDHFKIGAIATCASYTVVNVSAIYVVLKLISDIGGFSYLDGDLKFKLFASIVCMLASCFAYQSLYKNAGKANDDEDISTSYLMPGVIYSASYIVTLVLASDNPMGFKGGLSDESTIITLLQIAILFVSGFMLKEFVVPSNNRGNNMNSYNGYGMGMQSQQSYMSQPMQPQQPYMGQPMQPQQPYMSQPMQPQQPYMNPQDQGFANSQFGGYDQQPYGDSQQMVINEHQPTKTQYEVMQENSSSTGFRLKKD